MNVGGDISTAGNIGQVLKSNGPEPAPTWQNLVGLPTSPGT
ncbi:hypothetical protein PFY10_19550 [Chryseobacterium daecheongense]|nr:hypothetical protein PFY10_19550 [Chryseobacterium daecheongense]